MTISKAIEMLIKVKAKHGDVDVYFDCPNCLQAFTPGKVQAQAVILTADKSAHASTETPTS